MQKVYIQPNWEGLRELVNATKTNELKTKKYKMNSMLII
jgi:hypothetical protein